MAIPTYNGSAIPVFSFQPDWKKSVSIRTVYGVSIVEALDTTEERNCYQPRELFGIDYTTMPLSAQEQGYLRTVMDLAAALPVAIPLWPFRTKLSGSDAPSGVATLFVDDTTGDPWNVFDQYALLWHDFDTWDVIDIQAVGATSISLNAFFGNDYVIGDSVIPLIYGKLGRPTGKQLTDTLGTFAVSGIETFNRLTLQDTPEDDDSPVLFSHFDYWLDGVPVLTVNPNQDFSGWSGGVPFVDQV